MYDEKPINEKILDDLLLCNEQCFPTGSYVDKLSSLSDYEKIKFLEKVLPGLQYVRNQLIFYVFSNGLTTGSINQDTSLDEFLYRKNLEGATNYSILQDMVGTASVYGECGLRYILDDERDENSNGNLYLQAPGTFAPLIRKERGIAKVVAWLATEDEAYISETDFNVKDIDVRNSYESFVDYFRERKLLVYSPEEFISVRNNTEKVHGESPLLKDILRINLLVSAYERLNYDINYDGPGRLMLQAKDGYVVAEGNEMSTSQLVNQSAPAQNNRYEKAKKEAKGVAKQIKESGSDSVIVLSNAFKDKVTHLPRVTKATQFFDWLDKEGIILAQDLGMSPSLLELGEFSGNVSMEKIIDNSMLNTIVPLRELYATQFSEFIASKIGVSKIYFDKYELQQAENEHDAQAKIVDMMKILHDIDETDLQADFAEMLRNSLHDENNEVRALKIGKEKEKSNETEYV